MLSCVVIFVFFILLISQLIGVGCVFLLFHNGILSIPSANPFLVMFAYLFLISLIFGVLIATVAGAISLRPLRRFIRTTKEVASGNFSVRFKLGGLEEYNQIMVSLNTMIEEMSSIETLRDDFVSNISHEFKTPIASIHGFAKLLKKENLPEESRQEYLDIIISESERLSIEIINFISVGKSHFFFLVKSFSGCTVNSDTFKDISSINFHNVAFTSSENCISDKLLKCNIIKGLRRIF